MKYIGITEPESSRMARGMSAGAFWDFHLTWRWGKGIHSISEDVCLPACVSTAPPNAWDLRCLKKGKTYDSQVIQVVTKLYPRSLEVTKNIIGGRVTWVSPGPKKGHVSRVAVGHDHLKSSFFVLRNKGPIRKVALKGHVAKTQKKHQIKKRCFLWHRDFSIFTTPWFCPEKTRSLWSHIINPRPPNPGGRRLKVQLPDGDEKLEMFGDLFSAGKKVGTCWL